MLSLNTSLSQFTSLSLQVTNREYRRPASYWGVCRHGIAADVEQISEAKAFIALSHHFFYVAA
jgi:hypothetical protein